MASKKVNIDITTRADTSGAQKAATSLDGLAAAGTRAGTGAESAAKGAGRVGQVASAAGFQVQDFAVQVAGGTSALTAMAQQAPQFLGVFGPGGAIAGALIAVGSIAAKVFMSMADDSANAAEQAEFLAGAVDEIGKAAGKAVGEDIDFGLKQVIAAAEEAEKLIDAYDRVTDAQNASALASLANAEKIRQAEVELARLRGEQVDESANIADGVAAESAARQEAARQQIAAQNEQLAKAQQQEEIAQTLFLEMQSQKREAENQRQIEAQKLELLRAQRDELTKQAAERGKLSEYEIPFMKTPAAERAQRELEAGPLQAAINKAQEEIDRLDAELNEKTGKLTESVQTAAVALQDAINNTATISEALAIEVPRIEQTLQAEEVKATISGLAEIGQATAQEISRIAETAQPTTNGQSEALAILKQAAADGTITANETAKVAAALQVLGSSINTGITGINSNVSALINSINTLSSQVVDQKRQIDAINARIRSGN